MNKRTLLYIVLMLAGLALSPREARAQGDSTIVYSEERPLIYEDAWDLWPYIFLNENGEPDGYNMELLKLIFKELDIPFVVKLKPTLEARSDLKNRKCDLMLSMKAGYTEGHAQYSRTIVHLFTHSIISPKRINLKIQGGTDLARHPVIVHDGSFSHHYLKDRHWAKEIIAFDDMNEAVREVSSKDDGLILWNTMSLKWLMRKFQTTNLQLTPFELPYGEYHFMSNDPHLLHQMDSVYNVLAASERLVPLQNKWFYPERQESGIPSWIWNLVGVMLLIALCALAYYMYYRVVERRMSRDIVKSNKRLSLILRTCGISFWTYDVPKQTFTVMDENGNPQRDYTSLEFSQRYSSDDFKKLTHSLERIINRDEETITLDIRTRDNEKSDVFRDYVLTLSVLRRERNGKPSVIMCTRNDVTEAHLHELQANDLMLRYQAIFENALIDMAYYDGNGVIQELNQKSCETFQTTREEAIGAHATLEQVTGMSHEIMKSPDIYHATHHQRLPYYRSRRDDKDADLRYYEMKFVPVFSNEGQCLGVYGTGRDVSETVSSYNKLRNDLKRLEAANAEVTEYISNIDYAMNVGRIRMARYDQHDHSLTIYSNINHPLYTLTQTRTLALVSDNSKRAAQRLLNSMDNEVANPQQINVQTLLRLGMPKWLQLNFIPVHDERGGVKFYFGMFRDISEFMSVEEQLKKETLRAQEVETLKNAFLRNMSYEIRTPLNAVVGFSELFELEHNSSDEDVFIEEIKKSASKLLGLITDILLLSRIDADMIELNPEPVDFAAVFDTHCQDAWATLQKPGVKYTIDNPYEKLMVEVDDSYLNIVIDKVINNAARYTSSGSVRARYDYIGNRLVISVEDTGCGIPEQEQSNIFDQFVTRSYQGAGLGLTICKDVLRLMDGSISLKSEVGKGTTVWFSIPAKATEIVRK